MQGNPFYCVALGLPVALAIVLMPSWHPQFIIPFMHNFWAFFFYIISFYILNIKLLRRAGVKHEDASVKAAGMFLVLFMLVIVGFLGVICEVFIISLLAGWLCPGVIGCTSLPAWLFFGLWNAFLCFGVLPCAVRWELAIDLPREPQMRTCVRLNMALYLAALAIMLFTPAPHMVHMD